MSAARTKRRDGAVEPQRTPRGVEIFWGDAALPFAFFSVPTSNSSTQQEALNLFLGSHRIVRLEKTFHSQGVEGFWSFCIEWLDSTAAVPGSARAGNAVDFKQILSEAEFEVFSKLRAVRKHLAQKDGIPVYAVATNEQLASMVRDRALSLNALQKVPGFGDSKVQRFGAVFLEVLSANHNHLSVGSETKSEVNDGSPT